MKEDLVEYQLVAQLYEALLEQCHDLGLVPPGVKRGEVVIYYQTELGNQANYHQLFVLPNGALFLSAQAKMGGTSCGAVAAAAA
jgi:hypothetical protein